MVATIEALKTAQDQLSWLMLGVMYAAFVARMFIRDNAPALEAEKRAFK